MRRTSLTILTMLASMATPALGQQAPAVAEQVLNPPVRFHAEDMPGAAQQSLKQRVGRMVAGAVIGGWVGYFASQVAESDWDAAKSGSPDSHRGTWAAAGVLSGAVLGRLINPAPARAMGGDVMSEMSRGRSVLTREQITASAGRSAHDVVRSLRPEWMQPRGINSFTEAATGSGSGTGSNAKLNVVAGEDHILVYLDNVNLGGTQHLQGIPVADIARMEFIAGPQATFRWGAGHAHGVILISTMKGPDR